MPITGGGGGLGSLRSSFDIAPPWRMLGGVFFAGSLIDAGAFGGTLPRDQAASVFLMPRWRSIAAAGRGWSSVIA